MSVPAAPLPGSLREPPSHQGKGLTRLWVTSSYCHPAFLTSSPTRAPHSHAGLLAFSRSQALWPLGTFTPAGSPGLECSPRYPLAHSLPSSPGQLLSVAIFPIAFPTRPTRLHSALLFLFSSAHITFHMLHMMLLGLLLVVYLPS